IDGPDKERGGRFLAVLEGGFGLDDPLPAFLGPGTFAEAPRRVKDPRPDTLGIGVPADPVHSAADRNILDRGHETGTDEVLVLGPGNREPFHFALVPFTSPVAYRPLQGTEVLVVARRNKG